MTRNVSLTSAATAGLGTLIASAPVRPRVTLLVLATLAGFAGAPATARAQSAAAVPAGPDSVTVAIGAHYRAGGLHRFWFGGAYRDLWTAPIRVPVLDLETFAGGLRPLKAGGGNETKSLHFRGGDGNEYTFRSIDKDKVGIPDEWKGGVIESVVHDMTSDVQPAGFLVAVPILKAAGILHVQPVLVAMPDDPSLGGFRATFAGRVGEIELKPGKAKNGATGLPPARRIITSDTLRALLDRDPAQRLDEPAYLAARLVDMLLNDWDRHPGQWKWAQLSRRPDAPWEPIPQDRDKVLISTSGIIPDLASTVAPDLRLVKFTDAYPRVNVMMFNSEQLDRRLLSGLGKPVWDSVARALVRRITDRDIDAAVASMPVEFSGRFPEFTGKLRHRRDSLPEIAHRFYRILAQVVDVHGTDAADRAVITYLDDTHVEVRLQSGAAAAPYFRRRFDARETAEVRVYLHGGDDTAVVRGNVQHAMPVRIIGGNGTNLLIDSSTVAGRHGNAHLYDAGTVTGVSYGVDTLFSRRPFVHEGPALLVPGTDFGSRLGPIAKLSINHDYGIEPRLGVAAYSYAFGKYPYASMIALDGQYSLKLSRYRASLMADKRFELSPFHLTALAQVSQLDLVNFHGYGNQAPQADTNFYVARQSQWLFQPAVAITLAPKVELSLAAVIRQSVTDTAHGHFVSDSQPYGYGGGGRFGEAGLQLAFHLDTRDQKQHARHGNVVDLTASYFPAVWDVTHPFESIGGLVAQYVTLPVPSHPFLALRVGGTKVSHDAPFEDAAFLGGRASIRTLYPQSYAGDASFYATAEVRIPVAKFTVLLPLNSGLLATQDVGRVWVNGQSPGGWHSAFGAGFWIGFHDLTADIRVMRSENGRPVVIGFQLRRPGGSSQ